MNFIFIILPDYKLSYDPFCNFLYIRLSQLLILIPRQEKEQIEVIEKFNNRKVFQQEKANYRFISALLLLSLSQSENVMQLVVSVFS